MMNRFSAGWLVIGGSIALLYGLVATPTPVCMGVGMIIYGIGCLWRLILAAWERSLGIDSPQHHSLGAFKQSFYYPHVRTSVEMSGPYEWMRAPWQVAHVFMSMGLGIMSGHFMLAVLITGLSLGCFGLQFVISEQNGLFGDDKTYQQYRRSTPVVNFKVVSWDHFMSLRAVAFEDFYVVLRQELPRFMAIIGVVVFICLFK